MRAYLCGDHDDFENLHTEFPWQSLSRPVLFTRAHKVVSQVVSQSILLGHVQGQCRPTTNPPFQEKSLSRAGFSYLHDNKVLCFWACMKRSY